VKKARRRIRNFSKVPQLEMPAFAMLARRSVTQQMREVEAERRVLPRTSSDPAIEKVRPGSGQGE
jgi:hypothetical protein